MSDWVTSKADVSYAPPRPPNFIFTKYPSGTKEWIDVALFSDEELRALATAYTEKLIQHARQRREKRGA